MLKKRFQGQPVSQSLKVFVVLALFAFLGVFSLSSAQTNEPPNHSDISLSQTGETSAVFPEDSLDVDDNGVAESWSSPDFTDTSEKPHTRQGGVSWNHGERTAKSLSRKRSS